MFLCTFAFSSKRFMYSTLIFLHSLTRWLVVISIGYAAFRGYKGYRSGSVFSRLDNNVRHWTATFAHLQLVLGIVLYTQSPLVKYYWQTPAGEHSFFDAVFYSVLHSLGMLGAVVIITIGSALSKRKSLDSKKYKTMLFWYAIALVIILILIPWPFSPLSNRPFLR